MDLDVLFQKAVDSDGPAFVRAEHDLRQAAGPALVTVARARLKQSDPIVQLLAHVTLDAAAGTPTFDHQAALDYLATVGDIAARRAVRVPPPVAVANYLEKHFGERAVERMALHLAKGTDWPKWRRFAVVLYLQRGTPGAHPLATVPLIRVAAEASDPELRAEAVTALTRLADPDLDAKLRAERTAARHWPAALDALLRP